MLDKGLRATINSDDPAYFGGYIGENFVRTQQALGLNEAHIEMLATNAFRASFLTADEKQRHLAAVAEAIG